MSPPNPSALELSGRQRSHVLFVLSNARAGRDAEFLRWYPGTYRQSLLDARHALGVRLWAQHDVDITRGRYARLDYRYLSVCDLALDGAEEAGEMIELVHTLHGDCGVAEPPATWLYYPASEKVGHCGGPSPPLLTLAFANGTPGQEAEFREWYATRHLRHALNIAALVSGQCFERTQFQLPGAMEARFATIAIYEQEGTPESIVESFLTLPEGTLRFPMLDRSPGRFAEWSYRSV